MSNKNLSFLFIMLFALCSACGGGSDSSTSPAPTQPAPAPTPPSSAPTPQPITQATTPSFTDITMQSGLHHQWGVASLQENRMPKFFSNGIAAGDYDQDGDIDLFVHGGDKQAGTLFRNDGSNKFSDITLFAGLHLPDHLGSGASFADINGDGWLDLFIGGINHSGNYLFANDGAGKFTDITAQSGLDLSVPNTVSASFADYDKDGNIDVALSHWGAPISTNGQHLWRNTGSGVFESVNDEVGISDTIINPSVNGVIGEADYTFTPQFADFNNDGFIDLGFVGDFATTQLYLNNQNGMFTHQTTSVIDDQNGMGSAVGDYDNDGDLDWFVSSIYPFTETPTETTIQGNRLYQNQGDGTFTNVTNETGVVNGRWGWAACFADFNNDGYLDIFHTGGWGNADEIVTDPQRDFTQDPSRLFINQRNGTFLEKASVANLVDTQQGRSVSCFDSDADGDIDILVNNNSDQDNVLLLYRNDTGTTLGNYLTVKLLGQSPNTQALGARIYLTLGEQTQMREINSNSNFASQNPSLAHFGLGDADTISSVKVVWPDGSQTNLANVQVNQQLALSFEQGI